jgi:hypothetical protein
VAITIQSDGGMPCVELHDHIHHCLANRVPIDSADELTARFFPSLTKEFFRVWLIHFL